MSIFRQRQLLVILGLVALAPWWECRAQASDEEALDTLLDVLSEETEIATKTRMNADYVPGIVSVLDGEEMRRHGVRTVWDALAFVPGIEPIYDPSGTPSLTVRGIPFPFNSGSVQLMVNGASIARESAGLSSSTLLFPIELVERIEIIRGPGSVVYGDFAFQGLINVITRTEAREVQLRAEQGSTWSAYFGHSAQTAHGRWAINLAPYRSSEPSVPLSQRAGDERRMALDLSWQGAVWSLEALHLDREVQRAGANVAFIDDSATSLALNLDRELGATSAWNASLEWLSSELKRTGRNEFEGDQWTLRSEWTGKIGAQSNWLLGVAHVDGRIDSALFLPTPPPGAPPAPPLRLRGEMRRVGSAYVQGEWRPLAHLVMTLGARYDDNSDVGRRVTPRAALVWNLAPRHLIKLQYAEGFRGPTFFELYTDPVPVDLDFEVNRTQELSYAYQGATRTVRVTWFNARINDSIFRDFRRRVFDNVAMASSRGVELEYDQQIADQIKLSVHYARSNSSHNRNPQQQRVDIGAAADWLGQAALLWQPNDRHVLSVRYAHVGDRASGVGARSEFGLWRLAYSNEAVRNTGFAWQIALNNALNRTSTYFNPAPVADVPIDLREGNLMLSAAWRW